MNDTVDPDLEAIKKPYKKGPDQRPAEISSALRFRLVAFDKIELDTSPAYLVRGIIPREGLVVIWGPPKCGKSFWTFDLVMHIALGWEYRSRRVQRGTVVYVACEGERGLGARAEAFRRQRLPEDGSVSGFHLLATRLDLVADGRELVDNIRTQLGADLPAAVVIDTLNRSIAGSESSDEDMGNYVKAADAIREAFRCAVLIIHHCGLDDNRPRGHTSLRGAADAEISVRRDGSGLVTAAVIWMKDGPNGDEENSRLEVVDLGQDSDGEKITSCVIEPAGGEPKATSARRPLKGTAKAGYENLIDCVARQGDLAPPSDNIPAGARGVTKAVWRQHLEKSGLVNPDGNPREQLRRLVVTLKSQGAVGLWEDFVWPVT